MSARKRTRRFILQVNPILYDGFGHCGQLAEMLVKMNEWGWPIIDLETVTFGNVSAYELAHYTMAFHARCLSEK
jgi:hypothetical protein